MHKYDIEDSCRATATSLKGRSSWITSSYTGPKRLGVRIYIRRKTAPQDFKVSGSPRTFASQVFGAENPRGSMLILRRKK